MASGCLAMLFISLEWHSRILVFGLTNLACGLFALALWPRTWRKCRPEPKRDLRAEGVSRHG
jgi:hypothetical protein